MAKKSSNSGVRDLLNLVVWVAGVLVSLAVGFGMTDGILSVRYLPLAVTQIAGWVVVILALLGVVLGITDKLG
jgi:hypothetical protein|tara:strand:- start:229 stop:447 length:219 start_codon:yes stop_codon:yes gene_type:complete